MKKTLAMLEHGFESSSTLTPEFAQFYRTFKSEFTKEMKTVGATDFIFHRGHFYVSGFFTIGEQIYYFSLGDVRWMMSMPMVEGFALLYRTAKDHKDYTGGHNRYVSVKLDMSAEMCWYFKIV